MKLLKYNYRHLLKHDGKPCEENFIDPSTANIILSRVPRDYKPHVVDYKTVEEFLSNVNHALFYMIDNEGTDEFGLPLIKPSELLLLDFDEDKTWKAHEERINAIRNHYGLEVNGYYETHSFNKENAWKLRYVIRFDKAPTMQEYKDIMLFFSTQYGMDKYTTGFGRRVYGSSTNSGVLLTEKKNSLELFMNNISKAVTSFKDSARQQEAEDLLLVEKVSDSFDSLPIVTEFMSLETPQDLYTWSEKYHIEYQTDSPGRYMTFFQTIFNYSVFLGDDDRTDALVAKYVALGGSQRTKLGKKNRNRDGRPQFYKYFAWKKMTKQLSYRETNGFIDIIEESVFIDKYLDEQTVYSFLSSKSKQKLLVSTAGSGKTYTITKSLLENKHSFVFLMPTTAITNNQEKKHLDLLRDSEEGATINFINTFVGIEDDLELTKLLKDQKTGFFHSKNPIKEDIDEYDVIFATYDQFSRYVETTKRIREYLIVDEAHLLGQYQNISMNKMDRLRKITTDTDSWNLFIKYVHCTATPFNLPDIYDEKKCFLSESKKELDIFVCNERLGRTKIDRNVYFPNIFKTLQLHKPEMFATRHDGTKPRLLVFSNLSKVELPDVASACAKVIGYDKYEVITTDNKEDSSTYKYVVYEKGTMENDLVFATSILNTGVDIQGVFDYVLFLDSKDINSLLQALHRDRHDKTKVLFFMQDKNFIPKVFSEEEQKMVNVSGEKLPVSQVRYNNYRWLETPEDMFKRARSRKQHGDKILNEIKLPNGQVIPSNEPYYAQAEYYRNYVDRYVSPTLLSHCLEQLRVPHKITHVGAVEFSEKDVEVSLEVGIVDDGTYVQPQDISVEILATEIEQLRGRKSLNTKNQRIIRETYPDFVDTKEHKNFAKILKRFVHNDIFDPIDSVSLATAILSFDHFVYDSVKPEFVIEAVYHKLFGNYGDISKLVAKNNNRVFTTEEYREFLLDVKSYITAKQSNRITNSYIVSLLKDYGFEFVSHGRGKKIFKKI